MGILGDIWRILYPVTCPGCGKVMEDSFWCESCLRRCWNPRMISGSPSKYMKGCYTLCNYSGGVRNAVIQLKYNGNRARGKSFFDLLNRFPWWERIKDCDLVLPVPVSKSRRKDRGYNQVDLIFQKWMEQKNMTYLAQGLICMRHTNTQSLLTKTERYENMKGVFHINKGVDVKGKNILLVDDVYTTGATMEAAAHELKRAGAESVIGLTIASGAK